MSANDRQVGGKHYQQEYQHWDFVIDTNMHYLYGCATKYIHRWKTKNGIQDLMKAIHYIDKAEEHSIQFPQKVMPWIERFTRDMPSEESMVIVDLYIGHFEQARKRIATLIATEKENQFLSEEQERLDEEVETDTHLQNYVDPNNNHTNYGVTE